MNIKSAFTTSNDVCKTFLFIFWYISVSFHFTLHSLVNWYTYQKNYNKNYMESNKSHANACFDVIQTIEENRSLKFSVTHLCFQRWTSILILRYIVGWWLSSFNHRKLKVVSMEKFWKKFKLFSVKYLSFYLF